MEALFHFGLLCEGVSGSIVLGWRNWRRWPTRMRWPLRYSMAQSRGGETMFGWRASWFEQLRERGGAG